MQKAWDALRGRRYNAYLCAPLGNGRTEERKLWEAKGNNIQRDDYIEYQEIE